MKNKHEDTWDDRSDNTTINSHRAFFYLEHACNAWFSVEIALRFIVRLFLLIAVT